MFYNNLQLTIVNMKIVVSVSFSANREYRDYQEYRVFLLEFMTAN